MKNIASEQRRYFKYTEYIFLGMRDGGVTGVGGGVYFS